MSSLTHASDRSSRRLRGAACLVTLALVLPALALPAAAEKRTAADKFGRGLAAMTLGVMEVPGNIVQETRTNGALSGWTVGLSVGLGKLVLRTLVGVFDFVTAPFEVPPGFASLMEPEYPWEYFEAAPGRPFGFETGNYLAREERALRQIEGVRVSRGRGALMVRFPGELLFELGESDLSRDARKRLDKLAETLNAYPNTRISVNGFTDDMGSEAVNQQLSSIRARVVRDYLIKRDVPAYRIEAEGYGRAAPVASNSTLAGRRANRRVEIELRASEVGAYR